MKKKILGMAMGLMVLLGSSLCVCRRANSAGTELSTDNDTGDFGEL